MSQLTECVTKYFACDMCQFKMTVSVDAQEQIILVDETDQQIGIGGKLETHRLGLLHRAFSIFVFDEYDRVLIQKRAKEKYHSGGLWANTCCGHPRPGETVRDAAHRRLHEELGFQTDLSFGFISRYKADLDHGMTENELVHVFAGKSINAPIPEPTEVEDVTYADLEALQSGSGGIRQNQQTVWLRHYLDNHFEQLLRLKRICNLATVSDFSSASRSQIREKILGS
ncbi:MAG: isopentenyl-diphosphate Delta-isomerase [Pseudomonadota bacterium]